MVTVDDARSCERRWDAADSSGNEKAEEIWSGSTSSSRGSAPTVGIALREGVSELDVTAAFAVYTQSAAARTVAFATEDKIRTRHGLVLLTTSTREAPSLSRIVVPGAAGLDPRLQHWADGPAPRRGAPGSPIGDMVTTGAVAVGSPQRCRTSPTTPALSPPPRPRR